MIKPKALQRGDLIAVAASASPFKKCDFMPAIKRLQALGFRVTFRKDIFSREDYLAGSDRRRADELNQFFADPDIKGIFFARGGYGTQRILPLLDTEEIKNNPKVVAGYSDITALLSYLYHHGIGGTFYSPTIVRHLRLSSQKTVDLLFTAVTSNAPLGRIAIGGAKVLKDGSGEGRLIGGCLSLITSAIGTPYELPTDESILFLEDVSEPVYKYDRMLTHLKAAGKLRGVRGIIFGSMGLSAGEKARSLNKMLKVVLADFPGPIITGFPAGHLDLQKLFVTLPLGVNAKLTTEPIVLEISEPALSF